MSKNKIPKKVIRSAEKLVQDTLRHEKTGHDWYHINRVRNVALKIAKTEKVDSSLVEMMALLHEAADYKLVGTGNEKAAMEKLKLWLKQQGVDETEQAEILYVIENQSYSASGISGKKLTSRAGQVVQDADRLEALGAIGIARVFVYSGKIGLVPYDPTKKPVKKMTVQEYKKGSASAINHFYEKLLKLRDLMNTKTGRRLATQRHRFMEKYLEEFFAEWKGQK